MSASATCRCGARFAEPSLERLNAELKRHYRTCDGRKRVRLRDVRSRVTRGNPAH